MDEAWLRIGVFLTILAAMAFWETILPKRPWKSRRRIRWTHHLVLSAVNTAVVRIALPVTVAAYALHLESIGFGLLNVLGLPAWIKVVCAILLLDLAIYAQHVLFHKIPLFWRLHRMHHTDLDFDVTTGIRFHPLEILLSMAIKFAIVALIGAPATAVVIFEIILNATSMFNHGNVRLHPGADRILRLFIVTPDMHRVHHSVIRRETDSNFGFNVPWWDRIFGTYNKAPEAGHDGMTIGLEIFADVSETRVDRLITQPFRNPARRNGRVT